MMMVSEHEERVDQYYRRATDELGRMQDEFYTWAKNTLAGL